MTTTATGPLVTMGIPDAASDTRKNEYWPEAKLIHHRKFKTGIMVISLVGLLGSPAAAKQNAERGSERSQAIAAVQQTRRDAMQDLRSRMHDAKSQFLFDLAEAQAGFDTEIEALDAEHDALVAECEAEGADQESCDARFADLAARQEALEADFLAARESLQGSWDAQKADFRVEKRAIMQSFKEAMKALRSSSESASNMGKNKARGKGRK